MNVHAMLKLGEGYFQTKIKIHSKVKFLINTLLIVFQLKKKKTSFYIV